MHKASRRFYKLLNSLPKNTKETAIENFQILKSNPNHPSLHFKKVGKYWSARIGIKYRALATFDGEDYIWIWTGTHDEYDRLLG